MNLCTKDAKPVSTDYPEFLYIEQKDVALLNAKEIGWTEASVDAESLILSRHLPPPLKHFVVGVYKFCCESEYEHKLVKTK